MVVVMCHIIRLAKSRREIVIREGHDKRIDSKIILEGNVDSGKGLRKSFAASNRLAADLIIQITQAEALQPQCATDL